MVKKGLYKHYNNKLYEVIGTAYHSETLEELVVYSGLYDDPKFGYQPLWVRPAKMFLEEIEIDGIMKARFEYQQQNA